MNDLGRCGAVAVLLTVAAGSLSAEKELMYDPEKGIIFVERKEGAAGTEKAADKRAIKKKAHRSTATDLHVGRKKDPPELYFKSGLEYFKNGDFNSALKNFRYADSLEHHPEYMLFAGKTLRNLNRKNEMIKVMFDILKQEPDCDVADDALLELALFYKMDDDYDKSITLFTRLIEQYPFGTEFSTGEELSVLAREQRRLMRAELINMLTTLGFTGEDLQTAMRAFQKAHNLLQTGAGDHGTMAVLREVHREYLRKEDKKARNLEQIDQFTGWIYGAIAAGVVNVLLLSLLLFKAQAHKKHVAELMQIVSELEVKKV